MPYALSQPIQTRRLALRSIESNDLDALFEIHQSATVTRYITHMHWPTRAAADTWFARVLQRRADQSAIQCVVVLRAEEPVDEIVIGTAMLFNFDASSALAEIGYLLGEAYWAKGYMVEALNALINTAFNELGLRRLEATVDTRNVASNALLLKLGFALEGCLRQRWVSAGETPDVNMFGLLKSDWLRRESKSIVDANDRQFSDGDVHRL